MAMLKQIKCILAFGKIAFDGVVKYYADEYELDRRQYGFSHGAEYILPDGRRLIAAYHPSPRNVYTKKLTESMMLEVLAQVRKLTGETDE